MVKDFPQLCVVFAKVASKGSHRNVLGEAWDHCFEEEAEATAFSTPWCSYLQDVVVGTFFSRVADLQEGFVLEEVKVSPCGLLGFMDRGRCLTFRAWEVGPSFEVDLDGEFAFGEFEVDGVNPPGRGDAEGC